jgi:hypothetical protein
VIDEYVEAAVQRLLTEHAGLAEQGISVATHEHKLVLCGEVESRARRDEIVRLVHENFPDVPLSVDIGITRAQAPSEAEELP